MTIYHFTNNKFDEFDTSKLGMASAERCVSDEMESISAFGFCFIEEENLETFTELFGDDFGEHLAECELYGSENFDSTYDDFVAWIERDGADAVRECLENDGVDFLRLHNGNFEEIIPLHMDNVEIIDWIK